MDKVIVDWVDINEEMVMNAVISRLNYKNKTAPSDYIKIKIIKELLNSLSKEEKELIYLHFYEGYSLRRIAKLYKTNYINIYKKINNILNKMKEVFYVKINVLYTK